MTADFDRAAARERAEKATPGPWEFTDTSDPRGHKGEFRAPGPYNGFMLVGPWCNGADAEFIAHARTDLPAALDALDAAEATIARVRALADQWAEAPIPRGAYRWAVARRDTLADAAEDILAALGVGVAVCGFVAADRACREARRHASEDAP